MEKKWEQSAFIPHTTHFWTTELPLRIWCAKMDGWKNIFLGLKGPMFLHSWNIKLILYIFVPRFTKNSIIQEIFKIKLNIDLFGILAKQVDIYTLYLVPRNAWSK